MSFLKYKKELKVFIIPNGTDCPETLVTLASSLPSFRLDGVQSTQ